MARSWNEPRTADELPDDDKEAIYQITGGLYDGSEVGRRERKLWPKRNCPPSMKKDPVATARFKEAVMSHDDALKDIEERVASGEIDLSEISEAEIIGGLRLLSLDKRRPAVQLGAFTRLAELKGMLKNNDFSGGGASDDQLEQMLEERDAASGRNRVPDKLPESL